MWPPWYNHRFSERNAQRFITDTHIERCGKTDGHAIKHADFSVQP